MARNNTKNKRKRINLLWPLPLIITAINLTIVIKILKPSFHQIFIALLASIPPTIAIIGATILIIKIQNKK